MKKFLFFIGLSLIMAACKDKKILEPDMPKPPAAKVPGESYAGGIIVYVDNTGQHGVVAATTDQSSVTNPSAINFTNIVVATVSVSNSGPLTSVYLDITHPNAGDLSVYLIAPNGTDITLTSNNGSFGDNYRNTVFSTGYPSITSGFAPFTGTYSPQEPFSMLSSSSSVGTWSLVIVDATGSDNGTLIKYSLKFSGSEYVWYPDPGMTWSPVGIQSSVGATSPNGQSNTTTIVNAYGTSGSYAALFCDQLVLSGYTDWFLPSTSEMDYMFNQRSVLGLKQDRLYWTSSESSTGYYAWAWSYTSSSGYGDDSFEQKYESRLVRPVRKF